MAGSSHRSWLWRGIAVAVTYLTYLISLTKLIQIKRTSWNASSLISEDFFLSVFGVSCQDCTDHVRGFRHLVRVTRIQTNNSRVHRLNILVRPS
jgi:hypothetical protein